MAGIAISGTEDEDHAEYFVDHEDAGELQDPLVDNAETEEAMKAKLKELDRLAEFGVYETVDLQELSGRSEWQLAGDSQCLFALCETVDLQVALGKKRVMTPWHIEHRKNGIRARFVAREFEGDEAMYDAFAPSSTPSTERIID